MRIGNRQIDHIVYSVPNLDEACSYLADTIGVKPVFGGYHKTQGTKNALLNLGDACYLEILAVDETNESISGPRWMGIDLIQEARITRWAIKSDVLIEDQQKLREYSAEMGEIYGGSRQTPTGDLLQWEMILPLAAPKIELAPFMVNWSPSSIHPTEKLTEECALIAIEFGQRFPDQAQGLFAKLQVDENINKTVETHITIQLKTKSGDIVSLR